VSLRRAYGRELHDAGPSLRRWWSCSCPINSLFMHS